MSSAHNRGMARTERLFSARVRVLGAILAVATVGLVVAGSLTFVWQRERTLADVDTRLYSQTAGIRITQQDTGVGTGSGASPVTEPLDPDDYVSVDLLLRDAVARLVPGRNEASVGIVDGDPTYRSRTLNGFDISTDTALLAKIVSDLSRTGLTQLGTASTDQGQIRYLAIPVTVPGDDRLGVYVRAVNLDEELAPLTSSVTTYSVAALAVLLAIAAVGWFVVGRIVLSPIRQLQLAAGSIAIGNPGTRVPTEGNDDIADVGRTVNEMLDRVESSVAVQRQLLDDIRHELKTPITIVRGHLEMMDPNDPTDVASTAEIGISELDRMTRLVEAIDMLATAQDDEFTIGSVDIGALTARVGELVVAIPGHPWTVATSGNGMVLGNPDRLLQAWLALADNAAKHTPAGTPIEIGSTMSAGSFQIWVRDHGPGIPPALRHRIFRRFDRGIGHRVGGSGLGLAIVDAIARGHGGSCTVTDTPGGGATFTIHVPARPGSGQAALPAPVRAGDVVQQREETG